MKSNEVLEKYLKYKTIYLKLKKDYYGGGLCNDNPDMNYYISTFLDISSEVNLSVIDKSSCQNLNYTTYITNIKTEYKPENNKLSDYPRESKLYKFIDNLCVEHEIIDKDINFLELIKQLMGKTIKFNDYSKKLNKLLECIILQHMYADFTTITREELSTTVLIIPNTISTIEQNSPNIEHIIFQKNNTSLTKLGENAFRDNVNLQSVDLSSTQLEEIDKSCFLNCNLTEVKLPNSLTKLGHCAFKDNLNLQSINLSSTQLTEIGNSCFLSCNLTEIKLPNSLTKLGKNAFRNNANLNSVDLSSTQLTVIDDNCFSNCNLTSVKLPNSLTTLGECAFKNNKNLQSVDLSSTQLRKIGYHCFLNCNLNEVKLPKTVTILGYNAFDNNKNLNIIHCSNDFKEEFIKKYPSLNVTFVIS